MARSILDDAYVQPAIRETMAGYKRPAFVTCRLPLRPTMYLGYGSYMSSGRRRLALKLWTGWPTFPMVFVKGVLAGGASDLNPLIASGEIAQLLASTHARSRAGWTTQARRELLSRSVRRAAQAAIVLTVLASAANNMPTGWMVASRVSEESP